VRGTRRVNLTGRGLPSQAVARIPELDYTPTARWAERAKEDVLFPLIEASNCIAVPGAYFGDEVRRSLH
jgi:hypothetical protein